MLSQDLSSNRSFVSETLRNEAVYQTSMYLAIVSGLSNRLIEYNDYRVVVVGLK